jgi:mannose-6-phosphate isomerase-like protein (cupin superfamily)
MNYKEQRPWGEFENLLDNELCKVKIITIKPEQSPSYQYHFKRSEVWTLIQGSGELKLNDNIIPISKGYTYHIEKEAKHQIKNTGTEDLIFIEIQLGEYFGEDDIVRLEDNYGRL